MSNYPSIPAGDLATTLAVKYRPKFFSDLSGQRHIITILKGSIKERKVPQQILFSGGSGLGKTTIARVLASSLLCLTPQDKRNDFEPCGDCDSCKLIFDFKQSHSDLIEFDAASNGGKDEIKDIAQKAQYSPVLSEVKVYIIDEVHGLSGAGGQAFLKLLEEPPSHVIFMLCTTDPEKMLKTNRGRCVEFSLFKPTLEESLSNLKRITSSEGWHIDDYYLREIINSSDPDLGIRGQVTNLAKLSSVLSIGENIDDELISHLLGIVSKNKIKLLFKAVNDKNPLHALDLLNQMRSYSDETFLRTAIINFARDNWINSLKNGNISEIDNEVYRKLVAMPEGKDWTDLTIAQISRPELSPTMLSPVDFELFTNESLNKLNSAIVTANQLLQELDNTTIQKSEILPKIKKKNIDKNKNSHKSTRVGPGKSKNTDDSPSLFEDDSFSNTVRLITASNPAPVELASILNKCTIAIKDGLCIITVPIQLKDAYLTIEEYASKGSSRLGLNLSSVFI